MQMLGHKDIRMTMSYVEVVQLDLQHVKTFPIPASAGEG
jgi:hypothetical protein